MMRDLFFIFVSSYGFALSGSLALNSVAHKLDSDQLQ